MNTMGHGLRLRTTGVLVLFILAMGAIMAIGQQKPLPSVISASVPFYPRITQQAHIGGVVRLRISTDGNRVASVEVESGQPMLAQAAQENVAVRAAQSDDFRGHFPLQTFAIEV